MKDRHMIPVNNTRVTHVLSSVTQPIIIYNFLFGYLIPNWAPNSNNEDENLKIYSFQHLTSYKFKQKKKKRDCYLRSSLEICIG